MGFKSLEESPKCQYRIPCGQTDESKRLAHWHIFKTAVRVLFCVFLNLIQVH